VRAVEIVAYEREDLEPILALAEGVAFSSLQAARRLRAPAPGELPDGR
jgi:hypothetical protein